MRSTIWAFVERMFPRVGTALIMLLLAVYVLPEQVGVYTLCIMFVMLVQTMTDGSVRGIAVACMSTRRGQRFIERYQVVAAALGTAVVASGLIGIYFYLPEDLAPFVWSTVPLLLIPVATAARVKAVALLQIGNAWRNLASHQLVAAAAGLSASIPVLLVTKSILASSVQAALTELVFSALVLSLAQRTTTDLVPASDPAIMRHPGRELWHVSVYQLFGWIQSQGDRLLIGYFAGSGALGQWAFGQNVARSAGDSVALSTTNLLRPALFSPVPDEDSDMRIRRVMNRSLLMVITVVTLTVVVALSVLPVLLDPAWDAAIEIIPIMGLASIITTLSWSLSVFLLKEERMQWASRIKVIGILMAVPIGLVALYDFSLAAWVLVGRELIETLALLALTRRSVPWSAVLRYFVAIGLGAVLTLIIGADL